MTDKLITTEQYYARIVNGIKNRAQRARLLDSERIEASELFTLRDAKSLLKIAAGGVRSCSSHLIMSGLVSWRAGHVELSAGFVEGLEDVSAMSPQQMLAEARVFWLLS